MGSHKSSIEEIITGVLKRELGWSKGSIDIFGNQPAFASPSWLNVESYNTLVRNSESGEEVWCKYTYPDTNFYINIDEAYRMARICGAAGFGPKVHAASVADRVLISDVLDTGWEICGTHLGVDKDFVRQLAIELRKLFDLGSELEIECRSIFEEIYTLAAGLEEYEISTWHNLQLMLAITKLIEDKLDSSKLERIAFIGEANLANVFKNTDGELRFIDYDCCRYGTRDEAVGIWLMELSESDEQQWQIYQNFVDNRDRIGFYKSWLMGMVDDIRWGLIATTLAVKSGRIINEFMKYAGWRLERAEFNMYSPLLRERVAAVAAG